MKDLTKGNITQLLIMFAIPVLIGNIFQQFYNLTDTAIIGNMIEDNNAIASIGAVSPVMSFVINFICGLTNGFSIVIGRHFGAKDIEQLKRSVACTIVLGVCTALIITIISIFSAESIIRLLGTPEEIIPSAKAYIIIIFAGTIFSMFYNLFSGMLRAIGNTTAPLFFLGISMVINVILDIFFIGALGMGVEGTAIATIIAQCISSLLCFIYIMKKCPVLVFSKKDFKIEKNDVIDLYSTGLSMGLMLCIVSVGSIILQGAINGLGKDIIASHTLARKISEMFMLPYGTIGMASSAFISQNIGAGKIDRVKQGLLRSVLITAIWSTITVLVIYFFGDILLKLIAGDKKAEIISVAWYYLKINTPFYYVLGVLLVMRSSMQSMGMKIIPIASSIIELIGKFLISVFFVPSMQYFGVCISEPSIWIVMTAWLVIFYFIKIKDISQEHQLKEAVVS